MSIRYGAISAIIGGAATALSGVVVQGYVQPASTVPDTMWSYPWPSDALVPVSLVYAVFHVLVFLGVLGFARSGVAGPTRSARIGAALAATGTGALFVAELATIPFREQRLDALGPAIVGSVFGLGVLLTAVGFLLAGVATLRVGRWQDWRRFVPLAVGIWTTLLLGVSFTGALAAGVGVYGLFILVLGVALCTEAQAELPVTRAKVVH